MDNHSKTSQPVSYVQHTHSGGTEKPFWQSDAFIVLMLVFFGPIGVILMWVYAPWKKWVKILITIIIGFLIFVPFVALVVIYVYLMSHFSGQFNERNSFNTLPPSSVALTQTPEETKVYYFEDLVNGYTKVTSPKYAFSFEFPSDLKYFPPFGKGDGMAEGIGFHTEKRMENDFGSSFFISVTPSLSGNPCAWPETIPTWKATTLNGLPAATNGKEENMTIIACSNGKNYSFSYRGEYTPKNEGVLTAEEKVKEKSAFDHMLKTFSVDGI